MPDNNKLKLFTKINMHIVKTCMTCRYGVIRPEFSWGFCMKHSYKHEKHQTERNGPAHISCCCNDWEQYPQLSTCAELGAYTEILDVR